MIGSLFLGDFFLLVKQYYIFCENEAWKRCQFNTVFPVSLRPGIIQGISHPGGDQDSLLREKCSLGKAQRPFPSPAQCIWHRLHAQLPVPVIIQNIGVSCICTVMSGISSGRISSQLPPSERDFCFCHPPAEPTPACSFAAQSFA